MWFDVRPARMEDHEGLCEIFAEVDALHHEAVPAVFQTPSKSARTRDYLSSVLADKNAALLVAEREGRLIGVIQARVREMPDVPIFVHRRYAAVEDIAVRKECRRSGVGRALMEKAQEWARARGLRQVELNVWEFNREAIAFYEKLGYRPASRKMWKALDSDGK
jgi:diamine N-acetyltransferase